MGRNGVNERQKGLVVQMMIRILVHVMVMGAVLAGAGTALAEPVRVGQYTVTKIDALPYVESEYTKRFRFESMDNPKLAELRKKYQLDEVVAAGKDEFEKQILLLDWVNHSFKKFGRPSTEARGAIKILEAVDEGHTFFCAHYTDVFVSAAASMGWVDRAMALRRPDNIGSGSTEH